ncbi:MAG: hypothetical protein P1P65_05745 [Treponema sp.]
MLKNTAFHDNLYQLARIIDMTAEGLRLDLSEHIFLEKTVYDLCFVSKALQGMFADIQEFSHLPEYAAILQCFYSCETGYLLLLKSFAAKSLEKKLELPISAADLTAYHKIHTDIKTRIEDCLHNTDENPDSYQMVSKNELAELLSF